MTLLSQLDHSLLKRRHASEESLLEGISGQQQEAQELKSCEGFPREGSSTTGANAPVMEFTWGTSPARGLGKGDRRAII